MTLLYRALSAMIFTLVTLDLSAMELGDGRLNPLKPRTKRNPPLNVFLGCPDTVTHFLLIGQISEPGE